jgi:hypothetical protein
MNSFQISSEEDALVRLGLTRLLSALPTQTPTVSCGI